MHNSNSNFLLLLAVKSVLNHLLIVDNRSGVDRQIIIPIIIDRIVYALVSLEDELSLARVGFVDRP